MMGTQKGDEVVIQNAFQKMSSDDLKTEKKELDPNGHFEVVLTKRKTVS